MRKLMMILTALLLVATVLQAQPGRNARTAPRGAEKHAFAELDLSESQQAQLKEIRTATRSKLEALRASAGDQRPDREAARAIMEAARQDMEAVLTPTQREELAAKRAARKEAWESVDKEALKADLKAHRAEVMEVVKAARSQLDGFISDDDQARLTDLRAVMATRPKADRPHRGQPRPAASDEEREQRRAAMATWRADHSAELEELKGLAEKYAEDIRRIQKSLQPQTREWKAEKREILESYLPARERGTQTRRQRSGGAEKGQHREATKRDRKGGGAAAVKFLLLEA